MELGERNDGLGRRHARTQSLADEAIVIVAIHQPNYMPWLGYFAKMARCDVFVFLDHVQFSKNSYINRVQIDGGGKPRWLTVPVSHRLGDAIDSVRAADKDWPRAHLESLKTSYSRAAAYRDVWTWLSELYRDLPHDNIAASNQALIEAVVAKLGLKPKIRRASQFDTGEAESDDRLVAITSALGGDTYLSGSGGANYQDEAKFKQARISVIYSDFVHPVYDQGRPEFLPGLSVLDALFRLGFERTAPLLARAGAPA